MKNTGVRCVKYLLYSMNTGITVVSHEKHLDKSKNKQIHVHLFHLSVDRCGYN